MSHLRTLPSCGSRCPYDDRHYCKQERGHDGSCGDPLVKLFWPSPAPQRTYDEEFNGSAHGAWQASEIARLTAALSTSQSRIAELEATLAAIQSWRLSADLTPSQDAALTALTSRLLPPVDG